MRRFPRQEMLAALNELPESRRLGLTWRGVHGRVRATRGDHQTAQYALIVKDTVVDGFAWALVKQVRPSHESNRWQSIISNRSSTQIEAAEIAMVAWVAYEGDTSR